MLAGTREKVDQSKASCDVGIRWTPIYGKYFCIKHHHVCAENLSVHLGRYFLKVIDMRKCSAMGVRDRVKRSAASSKCVILHACREPPCGALGALSDSVGHAQGRRHGHARPSKAWRRQGSHFETRDGLRLLLRLVEASCELISLVQ